MTRPTLLTLATVLTSGSALAGGGALGAQSASHPTIGSIERLSPALDAIVPPGAVIEVLSDGHAWVVREGAEETLWLQPAGYTKDVPRTGESGSNGLLLGRDGRLILAQHGDRRLARLDAPLDAPRPVFETLAGAYEGNRRMASCSRRTSPSFICQARTRGANRPLWPTACAPTARSERAGSSTSRGATA